MKKVLGLLAGLAIALGLSSCGDDVTKWNVTEEQYQLPVIEIKYNNELWTPGNADMEKPSKYLYLDHKVLQTDVLTFTVKASKKVNNGEAKDCTDEVKDTLEWYIGDKKVEEKVSSMNFFAKDYNKGDYTIYCKYSVTDADGKNWTYISRPSEFSMAKAGVNVFATKEELEFGAKNGTTSATSVLTVEDFDFKADSYNLYCKKNEEEEKMILLGEDDDLEAGYTVNFETGDSGKYVYRVVGIVNGVETGDSDTVEINVNEITINEDEYVVTLETDVVDSKIYAADGLKVSVTPKVVHHIAYSDLTDSDVSMTVQSYDVLIGEGTTSVGSPFTAEGNLSTENEGNNKITVKNIVVITKPAEGETPAETETLTDEKSIDVKYIAPQGEVTYKAVLTLDSSIVKETVEGNDVIAVTPALKATQKYTDSEDKTVDIGSSAYTYKIFKADTELAVTDGKIKASDLGDAGDYKLKAKISYNSNDYGTEEVDVKYIRIAKTDYKATVTQTSTSLKASVDLSKIFKLTAQHTWTDETNDAETDVTASVQADSVKWYQATSETGEYTEIAALNTDYETTTTVYLKVKVGETESAPVAFEISAAKTVIVTFTKDATTVSDDRVVAGQKNSNKTATYNGVKYVGGQKLDSKGSVMVTPKTASAKVVLVCVGSEKIKYGENKTLTPVKSSVSGDTAYLTPELTITEKTTFSKGSGENSVVAVIITE
ncbi:MAG: hypothetical protein KBT11_06300 [Treponema sp.]|nr:hypothetical protein [Candidatus Treponema equifaecale]